MRLLELLVPPIVLLSSISVAQPEKVTLEIDEEESSRSTITFEPVSSDKKSLLICQV